MALGIIAIALLPLLALVPMGLNNQRSAVETTAITQILQSITGDLQRSEFDQLVNPDTLAVVDLPIRYFDELGSEIDLEEAPAVGTGARMYDAQITLDYPAFIGSNSTHAMVRAEIRVAFNPQHLGAEVLFADDATNRYVKNFALIAKTSK